MFRVLFLVFGLLFGILKIFSSKKNKVVEQSKKNIKEKKEQLAQNELQHKLSKEELQRLTLLQKQFKAEKHTRDKLLKDYYDCQHQIEDIVQAQQGLKSVINQLELEFNKVSVKRQKEIQVELESYMSKKMVLTEELKQKQIEFKELVNKIQNHDNQAKELALTIKNNFAEDGQIWFEKNKEYISNQIITIPEIVVANNTTMKFVEKRSNFWRNISILLILGFLCYFVFLNYIQ